MRKLLPLLAVILLLLITFSTNTYSQALSAVSSTQRGDINEDGKVDVFDLLEMLKSLAGQGQTERKRQIADMNASGGVDVFDLLGMLKVLAGAEQPGVIYWGPVITGSDRAGAAPGDSLVLYTENADGGLSIQDIKVLVNGAEYLVAAFNPDSTLIVMPESFTGGELSLILGADTTKSIHVKLLVKVAGKVEVASGLNLSELTVFSIQDENRVGSDGSFNARLTDSTEATFIVATNASGAPVLLSFMTNVPGTGLSGVKGKEGFTKLSASDNISLGVQSTALSLVMLNPAVFGTSAQERKAFAERAAQHTRFQELVTQIGAILNSGLNPGYLVDDSHPEIFRLADEIARDVYDGMEEQGIPQDSTIPDRSDPDVRLGENGQLEFSNPYYVHYGTALFDFRAASPKKSFMQKPRPWKWSLIPYTGELGRTLQGMDSGDSLSAVMCKGFDSSSPHWWDPAWPEGRGTLYNSGKMVIDVIDLVNKVPGPEEKLESLTDILKDAGGATILKEGFQAGTAPAMLRAVLGFIESNKDIVLSFFWRDAATDNMRNCVTLLHSVAGNVFKNLAEVDKDPFYVDLFLAPGKVTQNYHFSAGHLTPIMSLVSLPSGRVSMGGNLATLSAFQMGRYEVTNAQYAAFLNVALADGEITATTSSVTGTKGAYIGQEYIYLCGMSYFLYVLDNNNKCWISYNGTSFSVEPGKENMPVVYITWYGAKAFAMKYGFDLPTEAEWEYAARGGRQYEYGTDDGTISPEKANYNRNVGYPTKVGSYSANPFGLHDLSGNVAEWCNDWYGAYNNQSQTDPTGPSSGSNRVVRGGSWGNVRDPDYLRSGSRFSSKPDGGVDTWTWDWPGDGLGFRVVRRQILKGKILESGAGLSDVNVYVTGGGIDRLTATGVTGDYLIGLPDGEYTVIPGKSGYTFSPACLEVTVSGSDVTASKITATADSELPGDSTKVQGLTLISIPSGLFQMGLTRIVTLSAFQMGCYEITQAQYQAVVGSNPSYFSGLPGDSERPVEQVSWYDAVTFCNKLSEKAGLQPCYNLATWACDFSKNGFRLPTEAEWEYACRAGTTTKYYTGDSGDDLNRAAWHQFNSGDMTQTVGLKEPNTFRLFDMLGNVAEWCNDWYGDYGSAYANNPQGPSTDDGHGRTLRGGSYKGAERESQELTSFLREFWGDLNWKQSSIGFRVVRR
ncbi:SUMF1/EgtB/PvdO family nonheme iron enzyme [bacterium]|nr:SUMF1/EgtB/PvdO family nonheme iron enzyme [bacterium]